MLIKLLIILGISLTATLNSVCYAEIYKYKDEQGNWQFSDQPQKGENSRVYSSSIKSNPTDENETTTSSSNYSTDIKALLYKKYNPGNPIERASLATITIETHLAIGSGFFISSDGYILTNKHVVRPSASNTWQDTNDKFKERKKKFDKHTKKLDEEADILKSMHADLKMRENEIKNGKEQASIDYQTARYNNFKNEYLDRKQHYNQIKTDFDNKKRIFEKERSNFNIKSSMANVTKTFKIILKNEQTLTARLITVSKEYDLALLKLDRHTTPYIMPNESRVHQTMEVYAVGSPLGIRDSVTSGIITGIKKGYVLTDTKILPGNSGGPLLSKAGMAIGINTARVSEFESSEGLGIAIPMAIAHKEFAKYLPGH